MQLIDGRLELRDALSRSAEIAKVFAVSSLGFVGPCESVVSHGLVARRLGAQLSKGEGFALQLITKSSHLAAQRFRFLRADHDGASGSASFELNLSSRIGSLPELVRKIRDLNRYPGQGATIGNIHRRG